MKRILVPTDFSDCADHAFEAAVKLARRFKATLHLHTCMELPKATEDADAIIKETLVAQEGLKNRYPELEVTSSYSEGKLVDEVLSCIEQRGTDFVVMGSHGRSGVSEIFIGSNTQKVVRSVHLPVLIIKGELPDINFDQIVFASSFNMSEKEVFLRFKEIVAPFEPEIFLLGVKTSFFFDPPASVTSAAMEQFKMLASPFPCKTYIFKNANIESGIREFAETVGADLIAISNQQRNPLRRMFVGSNVEALINHSNLPVLTIDY